MSRPWGYGVVGSQVYAIDPLKLTIPVVIQSSIAEIYHSPMMRPFRLTILTGATHSKNQLPGAVPVMTRGFSMIEFSTGVIMVTWLVKAHDIIVDRLIVDSFHVNSISGVGSVLSLSIITHVIMDHDTLVSDWVMRVHHDSVSTSSSKEREVVIILFIIFL